MIAQAPPERSTALCTYPDGSTMDDAKTARPADGKLVVFFDIDNCLYSKDAGVAEMMKGKIRAYFRRLGLSDEEAKDLHSHYYREYGLAIRGLVRHHAVDALDYDKHCDAALPLDEVLKDDPRLRKLLSDIDRDKCHVWALTNAYKIHATRVLKLLGIADQFEGVISCDYGAGEFSCKPEAAFFLDALEHVSTPPPPASSLYFVDDSALNVRGAHALGWRHCVLFDEGGAEEGRLGGLDKVPGSPPATGTADGDAGGGAAEGSPQVSVVHDLEELRSLWREIFKTSEPNGSTAAAA
ncbi:Haloacid dehalogenase-like hydrolase-domain-containing protein [Rhodotorula diobovata]|uniref:Haloacid dehalogenase-like hydrolase-domain-containing protein n=1 Tax=Rhodotorula diobovata TaxID=5288 RepID=A0A5C5G0H5_9BASI|nr:Haloacid dehalogenase-like hydrolase-domain-containing protein [Rhodotorula diobovata]